MIICIAWVSLMIGEQTHADTRHRDSRINTTEPIAGNYYAGGSTVTIDSKLSQDAWIMWSTINIWWTTNQDITLFGDTIMIRWIVWWDLRAMGNTVQLFWTISGDVVIIASKIEIGNTVTIWGNVRLYASTIIYNGKTQWSLLLNASDIIYNGTVLQWANIVAQSLDIHSGSSIQGNVSYRTPQQSPSLESIVTNGIATYDPQRQQYNMSTRLYQQYGFIFIFWLCFVIISSIILYTVWYTYFKPISRLVSTATIYYGLLWCIVMLLIPILIIWLSLTIIGIPVAIIMILIYSIILITIQSCTVVVISQIIQQHYFTTNSFKDQFATICILISVWWLISMIWIIALIPAMCVIWAWRDHMTKSHK